MKDNTIFDIIKRKKLSEFQEYLKENPEKINAKYMEKNLSVLHYAVIQGDEKITKFIIDQIAKPSRVANFDIDVRDKDGKTPLHWAAFLGINDMIIVLYNNGANVNAMGNGHTPLMIAKAQNHTETINLLELYKMQESDSSISRTRDAILNADVKTLQSLKDVDFNETGDNGESLLHVAASSLNENFEQVKEMILFLIEKGLSLDAIDKNGKAPIEYAKLSESKNHSLITKFLEELKLTKNFEKELSNSFTARLNLHNSPSKAEEIENQRKSPKQNLRYG